MSCPHSRRVLRPLEALLQCKLMIQSREALLFARLCLLTFLAAVVEGIAAGVHTTVYLYKMMYCGCAGSVCVIVY